MVAYTSKFRIAYPEDADKVKSLPAILQAQAESTETALAGFDFNGQDTQGLTSRVRSLEVNVMNLLAASPELATLTVKSSTTTSQDKHLSFGIAASGTLPSSVILDGNKIRFQKDCLVIASAQVTVSRDSSWDGSKRRFMQFVRNWSGSGNPSVSDELARASWVNESSASLSAGLSFAADDTLSLTFYASGYSTTTISGGTVLLVIFPTN